jgi:hypothetical protein
MLSLAKLLRDGLLADVQLADAVVQACAKIDQGRDRDPEQCVRLFTREFDPDVQACRCGISEELLTKALIRHQFSHRSLYASLAHDTTSSLFERSGGL